MRCALLGRRIWWGGRAGLLTGVAALGLFIVPLLGLGGVWASCRYWVPPCLRLSGLHIGFGLVASCIGVTVLGIAGALLEISCTFEPEENSSLYCSPSDIELNKPHNGLRTWVCDPYSASEWSCRSYVYLI